MICQVVKCLLDTESTVTLQGTNISHQRKRELIFPTTLGWDMLVFGRVFKVILNQSGQSHHLLRIMFPCIFPPTPSIAPTLPPRCKKPVPSSSSSPPSSPQSSSPQSSSPQSSPPSSYSYSSPPASSSSYYYYFLSSSSSSSPPPPSSSSSSSDSRPCPSAAITRLLYKNSKDLAQKLDRVPVAWGNSYWHWRSSA